MPVRIVKLLPPVDIPDGIPVEVRSRIKGLIAFGLANDVARAVCLVDDNSPGYAASWICKADKAALSQLSSSIINNFKFTVRWISYFIESEKAQIDAVYRRSTIAILRKNAAEGLEALRFLEKILGVERFQTWHVSINKALERLDLFEWVSED